MKSAKTKYTIPIVAFIFIIIGIVYATFFTSLSRSNTTEYIYVDADDNVDSVFAKVGRIAGNISVMGFRTLIRQSNYSEKIRTGRYEVKPGDCTFKIFRHLKNGQQKPLNLTIPSVRTKEKLSSELSKKLMLDSIQILQVLNNEDSCRKLGYDTATIICMFIPNTYEVFWNISLNRFFERMKKESKSFWTDERKDKANALEMTPEEVITLASIVDEETSNNKEKPMIAGMYYNRLKIGMPLQADPTIKFAKKNFAAKRIYTSWLSIHSPYNTYRNTGLPPGPIRIPSIAGIDAVLNLVHHDYLYMCAKEDFSGTHNFAVTYSEHMKNAAKYSTALNARGIQ
jgi:UPF0755 protein